MSEKKTANEVKKGLEGVVFDTTSISQVLAEKKSLYYRGYAVPDLAVHCRFEQVAYLLLHGELPSAKEEETFSASERKNRSISSKLRQTLALYPEPHHPMDAIRTAVSFLGMEDSRPSDQSPAGCYRRAIELLAKIPTCIAADSRLRSGLEPVSPRDDLGIAENFFWMCFGEEPNKDLARMFDATLTIYAEHGFNASTFTARTVSSSLADMYGAVAAAIASLKGPLHGGANEAVMHMLLEIGQPSKADAWLDKALAEKRKIMGFGHRIYRSGDSRVPITKQFRDTLAQQTGGERWVEISNRLEERMIAEKGIYPNLDFPAAPTYYMMGFDIDLFTPIFVMARTAGWTAHILEQLADNRLVRPLSHYSGMETRQLPQEFLSA